MDKNLFIFKINMPKIIFLKRTKMLKDDICVRVAKKYFSFKKKTKKTPPNPKKPKHLVSKCGTTVV